MNTTTIPVPGSAFETFKAERVARRAVARCSFTDATSNDPEICTCGAAFVLGIDLSVVKTAHLEAT